MTTAECHFKSCFFEAKDVSLIVCINNQCFLPHLMDVKCNTVEDSCVCCMNES